MKNLGDILLYYCLFLGPAFSQNSIYSSPGVGDIVGQTFGNPVAPSAGFLIDGLNSGGTGLNVGFKLDRIAPSNGLLVVSPSSGTTPTHVVVGLNPKVAAVANPGVYRFGVTFTTIDQSPPQSTTVIVNLTLDAPAPAEIHSVVNSASHEQLISPGGLVSIFGTSLGPVLSADFDASGLYPTIVGNTSVTMNGIAAPLLTTAPDRIDAIAPYGIVGQRVVDVVVSHYGHPSETFPVQVADSAPAIFTGDHGGSGQYRILNCRVASDPRTHSVSGCTPNNVENPAPVGSAIALFATGIGPSGTAVPDGTVSIVANAYTAKPISVSIGGQPASVMFAGSVPYKPVALFQLNVVVPGVPPGPQAVVLAVGDSTTTQCVTVAIQ